MFREVDVSAIRCFGVSGLRILRIRLLWPSSFLDFAIPRMCGFVILRFVVERFCFVIPKFMALRFQYFDISRPRDFGTPISRSPEAPTPPRCLRFDILKYRYVEIRYFGDSRFRAIDIYDFAIQMYRRLAISDSIGSRFRYLVFRERLISGLLRSGFLRFRDV